LKLTTSTNKQDYTKKSNRRKVSAIFIDIKFVLIEQNEEKNAKAWSQKRVFDTIQTNWILRPSDSPCFRFAVLLLERIVGD
jgi:hypothetical protein